MKKFLLIIALLSIVVLVGLHFYLKEPSSVEEIRSAVEQITPTVSIPTENRALSDAPVQAELPETAPDMSETAAEDVPSPANKNKKKVEEKVYNVVEVMPTFPGGEQALLKFITQNLECPSIVKEKGIQGVVVLRFVVCNDGSVGDVVVQKGLHPECDKAAVKVIKSLPRFNPGMKQGEPVNVWFTCPIRFVDY